MELDLTKTIVLWGPNETPQGYNIGNNFTDREEAEAYRVLFEEAPRTKLEHGKMLAWMKFECRKDGPDGVACAERLIEGRALIAEIEGDGIIREIMKQPSRDILPIDLGIPHVMPLEPDKSGTGFINNFHEGKSTRGECAL